MPKSDHFIRIKSHNLLYGRIPKAANSSIKAALCQLLNDKPPTGTRTTSDKFWQHGTNRETELISLRRAHWYRRSHFSFSFVRNPFDRLVAAYNNKVIENEAPPMPMQRMGITHGMPFEAFIDILIKTPLEKYDVHVIPQSKLLCIGNKIIPKFVGRVEQISLHWQELHEILSRRGTNVAESLPTKNVRRSNRQDLHFYFSSDKIIAKATQIYADDFRFFYNDVSINHLLRNEPLPSIKTIQSRRLMLSKWLKGDGLRG